MILFLIGGIAPVTWGFSSPLRTEYNRLVTLYICPTLGHSFRAGAYVHEKVFSRRVTNSSQALKGGKKRRNRQHEVGSSFSFFLFGGSFEPLSFVSLRLELTNKFILKKLLTVVLNFWFYFKTTNCRIKGFYSLELFEKKFEILKHGEGGTDSSSPLTGWRSSSLSSPTKDACHPWSSFYRLRRFERRTTMCVILTRIVELNGGEGILPPITMTH